MLLLLTASVFVQPISSKDGASTPFPVGAAAPQALVVQPDAANGTDTFILSNPNLWNFGDNASLWVGRTPANLTVSRSLIKFDLSAAALPPGAVVVDASLGLYAYQGGAGTIQARRATSPWTEGTGQRSWARVPIQVRETAGVPRTNEPVEVTLSFSPNSIAEPARDLRLYSGGVEVPSQVYAPTYVGGQIASAQLWFDVTIGAYQTRSFDVVYSTNGTAVPAYRTKTWAASPQWSYGYTSGGASGVSVVDLEGDGSLDVVFGTADGWVVALDNQLRFKWSVQASTGGRSIPYTPQVVDIDRDGSMDVVVLTNDPSVVRLNRTGVRWTVPYTVNTLPYSVPVLLDVNDDGILDVLVAGRNMQADALNGVDGSLLRFYPAADRAYGVSVADITGDGHGELFFSSDDRLVHAYDRGGTQLWARTNATAQFPESPVAIGDVDNDGVLEVVEPDNTQAGPVFALRITTGDERWAGVPLNVGWREGGLTLADITGDGTLETFVGLESGTLFALRGSDGVSLWEYTDTAALQPLAPAVVDIDKDGWPEVIYAEEGRAGVNAVRVLDRNGTLVHQWNVTHNNPAVRTLSQFVLATPAVVDLDGDGTLEVVVPAGDGIQAFATGGLAHDWRTWGYNWNHTNAATGRTSPDDAPFLQATLGAVQEFPGAGASWDYRDGVSRWVSVGGDFGAREADATGSAGWFTWNITQMFIDWRAGSFPNMGLFLTEANEAAGGDHAFYSSDATNAALRPRLTITYAVPFSDPTPRIIGRIPDQLRPEDSPPWSLDLSSHAFDNDTPAQDLRWNVTGYDPAKIQITGLNTPGASLITLYPQENAWGNMRVTYWLTDPDGHYAARQAWVNLTPVDDPPTFNPPTSFVIRYNLTYVFDFSPYIADVDTPLPQLTMTSNDTVHTTVSGFTVSFLYPELKPNPWISVTLTVRDGVNSVAKVVWIKVTADSPPVLTRPLPDVTMMEGQLIVGVFDLDEYFTDPNNDALFFSYGYTHLNITIQTNHSVDIRALANWNGVERVTFRGRDTEGAIAEDTILVTVLPVDDPPTLDPLPTLRVHYDQPYFFNLDPYISDPDTPIDDINASTSSFFITVSGHLLILLYPFSMNGTIESVTIWIGDGTSVVSRTIDVFIGDDFPPYLRTKLQDRNFDEDTTLSNAYNLMSAFDDVDSSALFYSSGNVSLIVSIDTNGVVNLSALPNWFGRERVTFRAMDSLGAFAEDTVWITVDPMNDAPYFAPVPVQRLNVTATFLDLSPFMRDIDSDLTELSLSATDVHARVFAQGLLLTYSADATEEVQVFVSDGFLTGTTNITVIVDLPKAPPAQIPAWLYWIPFPLGAGAFAAFVVYRRRQIEWAFLVTNPGLLVCSMSRREPTALDTDLMTGMLTTIMDFANKSFSDETQRNIEGLDLGDRQLAIVRGDVSYLAVVYSGRTPGSLLRIMHSLLTLIETHHRDALGDIVDTAKLGNIPDLLQKLVKLGWWPFVTFSEPGSKPSAAP